MVLAEESSYTVSSKIRKHTLKIHHSLEIRDFKEEFSMSSPMHLFKQKNVPSYITLDSKEE